MFKLKTIIREISLAVQALGSSHCRRQLILPAVGVKLPQIGVKSVGSSVSNGSKYAPIDNR